MHVRAAHPDRGHLQQDLPRTGCREGTALQAYITDAVEQGRLHGRGE
jgi:hypothetical protein